MKQIIKGKLYNTETAKELGSWANYGGWRDFQHMEETLYIKKTGEYFLFGEGGPMTKYAERVEQNGWSGGSRIMPMSYEEARQWAEEKLDADKYEEIFGPVAEDDSKTTATISINAAKWESAKRTAQQKGMGISEYIESLLG